MCKLFRNLWRANFERFLKEMLCIRPVISYISNEQKMKNAQTLIMILYIPSQYLLARKAYHWF